MADIIVTCALGQTGFDRHNALLANLFQEVAGLDINTIRRNGSNRPLIEDCKELSKQRNHILHRGWAFATKDAAAANEISQTVYILLVEPILNALDLYIFHDGTISRTQYRTVKDASGHRVSAMAITFRKDGPPIGYTPLANGTIPVPPAGNP